VASIAVSSALDSTEASSGRASASTEASLDHVSPSIVASSVPALAFSGRASLSGQASPRHPLGGGRRRHLGGGHRRRRGGGLAPGEGRPDKGISQEQLTRTSWRGPQPMKPSRRTCLNETSRASDIAKDRDVHTGLRAEIGTQRNRRNHHRRFGWRLAQPHEPHHQRRDPQEQRQWNESIRMSTSCHQPHSNGPASIIGAMVAAPSRPTLWPPPSSRITDEREGE
jgi:hypothetical protein